MASKLSCASLSPATAVAEALPIPLAQVEAEIFAEEDLPFCDICQYYISENDAVKGLCETCCEHVDDGIKHYTEEFALASVHGKDAVRLFVLRQRADNCRDVIADAAGSYDGDLEVHEASLEEKMLNKVAAECLARLPTSFAPWWRDAWTHEKWCQMYDERKAAGWPLASADLPIVQRLAAAAVAKEDKMHEMKKAHQEEMYALKTEHHHERFEAWEEGCTRGVQDTEAVMNHKLKELEDKHAEILANIERARKEDMEAVEARHKREVTEAAARHKREMAERDKRYVDALDPLLGVRDRVFAECEKKCHDAERHGYAMGYAFADQKWNPVYKAVCEELELVRKEGANHQAGYIRLIQERDELILAQADLRQELDESAEANEKLEGQVEELHEELAAARKELSGWCERCVVAQNATETLRKKLDAEVAVATDDIYRAMRSDLEEMRAENKRLERRVAEESHWCKDANMATRTAEMHAQMLRTELAMLQKKNDALLELVGPTQKLMASNPELFGGEALPSGGAPAPGEARGTSSPRPPAIIRLPQVKEEDTERVEKFLKGLVRPFFRDSAVVVESRPSVLPGLVEVEPSTEGLCMALTEAQYQEMVKAEAEAQPEPVAGAQPEPVAGAQPEPVAGAKPEPPAAEPVAGAKPKPNYNHPNWPSPTTKRFAKHLAKHSGKTDPKTIKTHQDALEFIAKRANISVEQLLKWTINHYQSFSEPWTLVKGGTQHFHMGTAPATWWC